MTFRDFTDPEVEVQELETCHRSLIEHLEAVGEVDPARPSRLDGWSAGHVLAHLTQNADSHRAMLAGELQYRDGWAGRDLQIAEAAGRAWPVLIAQLRRASVELDAAYRTEENWAREVQMLAGLQQAGFLPLARRREVELHRVDLGLGYELEDVPIDYIERDARLLEAWWIVKHRSEAARLPAVVAQHSVRDRWAWLVGRLEVEGLPPASLF